MSSAVPCDTPASSAIPPRVRSRFGFGPRTAPRSAVITVHELVRHTQAEGLTSCDDLVPMLREIDAYNREVFGFGFEPDAIRIPLEDVRRIVVGLTAGRVSRPLVVDSPSRADAERLGLGPELSMVEHRVRCLARSGVRFLELATRLLTWRDARSSSRLWAGTPWADANKAFSQLARETMACRIDRAPRLIFVNDGDCRRRGLRVLGKGSKPDLRWVRMAAALGTRAMSPEAALLLLGLPDLRDGASSLLASEAPLSLGGLLAYGRIPSIEGTPGGVVLGWSSVDDPILSHWPSASTE